MATAVEPSSQQTTPPNPQAKLVLASLVGAVYVLAALAVVGYLVPRLWAEHVTPRVGDRMVDYPLWFFAECAAVGVLAWFGRSLAGANPPKGVRGGIFLMISAAVTIFFLVRAVGLTLDGSASQIGMLVVAGVLGFLSARLFLSPRGERWMVGIEEQGWLSTHQYKPGLGRRVRRLTMLGIIVLGGSGAYSLYTQNILPHDWRLAMPGTDDFTVVPGAQTMIPLILFALTLWAAIRAVNLPTFAEFLIATEAEMNKVSWTSRRRLFQDTVVVLVTTVLLTLFLLVVDLFWGWLLSRQTVGVLPSRSTDVQKVNREEARW